MVFRGTHALKVSVCFALEYFLKASSPCKCPPLYVSRKVFVVKIRYPTNATCVLRSRSFARRIRIIALHTTIMIYLSVDVSQTSTSR